MVRVAAAAEGPLLSHLGLLQMGKQFEFMSPTVGLSQWNVFVKALRRNREGAGQHSLNPPVHSVIANPQSPIIRGGYCFCGVTYT